MSTNTTLARRPLARLGVRTIKRISYLHRNGINFSSAPRTKSRSVRAAAKGFGQPADATPATASSVAELDELINALGACNSSEKFGQVVAENVLSFDQKFWMRLAARSDLADDAEKEKLTALANTVMLLVEKMVQQTETQLSDSGEVVQAILKAGANEDGSWTVPLSAGCKEKMQQAMEERADSLDEAFLSSCFAYIKKAAEDGLVEVAATLQKMLQLYAARQLSQADPQTPEDTLLQDVLVADEALWEELLEGLVASGDLSETSFTAALQKRMESTVLGLKSGSYSQRVQAEYLKELEERGKKVFAKVAGLGL